MIDVRINTIGGAGDGVADGPIFAPFTLPGEHVRGEVVDGRIAAPEILSASPDRQEPACQHFGACGGCALQHASDNFVAAWKRDQIESALRTRGISGVEIRDTQTSPTRSRRRATFAARRTKKTVQVGFHAARSDAVVPISECQVVAPQILAARPAIEAAARLGASRKGAIRAVATETEGGVDLSVEDAKALDRERLVEAAALTETHDLARLTWNGEIIARRRPALISFGPAQVEPPPGGFLQATEAGQAALQAAAIDIVGDAARVADLFAGAGCFALMMAAKAEVLAVEGEQALLSALQAGWRSTEGLKAIEVQRRDLFRRPLMVEELAPFDAVVIDPPRAGARAQIETLAKSSVPVIASISCDAGSFARDARILIDGGYTLDWVQPVDQFRWSPHVEIAARFAR